MAKYRRRLLRRRSASIEFPAVEAKKCIRAAHPAALSGRL